MQPEIKYIELKSGFSDDGPAWIGLVEFSKSGRTLYFDDKAFRSLKGTGIEANYYDIETGDEYWISGIKKNKQDRHWAGNGIINVDDRIVEDYMKMIYGDKLDSKNYKVVKVNDKVPTERIKELENESIEDKNTLSGHDLSFRQPNELLDEELQFVIEYLSNQEQTTKYNKARRSFKSSRILFEEELEKRNVL
ncbi:MAG: hypothetical protein WC044_02275 [Crocinitomicaceae bacterium]